MSKDYWCENELTTTRNRLDYKLLYIASGCPLKYIEDYLSYFGKVKVKRKIKSYFDKGYLKSATTADKLYTLTVPELKNILKEHGLKVTGKKDELVSRIAGNISENEYSSHVSKDECIIRTEKGKEYYDTLRKTKDTVLYGVFKNVALFIENSNEALAQNLAENFYASNHFKYKNTSQMGRLYPTIPAAFKRKFISEYGIKIYTALVANSYLGGTVDLWVIKDYLKEYNIDENIDKNSWHNLRLYFYNLRELYVLKKEGIQYYSISAANDERSCKHCLEMNEQKFKITDAKKGVNFPPFCDYCRCMILPEFEYEAHEIKLPNESGVRSINDVDIPKKGVPANESVIKRLFARMESTVTDIIETLLTKKY